MDEIKVDIEKFVNYFKNKRRFRIDNVEQIDKILTSQKYLDFINTIYSYYNSKVGATDNYRLSPLCYLDADRAINYFWEFLLVSDLNKKLKSKLKLV